MTQEAIPVGDQFTIALQAKLLEDQHAELVRLRARVAELEKERK